MNHIFGFLLVLILVPLSLGQTGNSEAPRVSKSETEVMKLERAWLDAYENSDAKAMNAIVADDFVITFPDGSRQTKPVIMDSIKTPRSSPIKLYTEDVRSRIYGDTVILMGRVITEYQRDGKTLKEPSSYTDTYVKRKGRWQVIASHLSSDLKPK